MYRKFIAIGLAVLSAGCVTGMTPDGTYPSETFTVPVGYQEAYRRADQQMRFCGNDAGVTGNLYTDNKTAVLRLTYQSLVTAAQERIDIRSTGDQTSEVKVTVWGKGVWDDKQIGAVRRSIETGQPACR